MSTVTIVSLSPVSLTFELPLFKKTKLYELPAAEPGSFVTLPVEDDFEVVPRQNQDGGGSRLEPWAGDVIGRRIAENWRNTTSFEGMQPGAHLGIWVVDGKLDYPNTAEGNAKLAQRVASMPEYPENREAQNKWCDSMVKQADDWSTDPDPKVQRSVGEGHRASARYLKITGRKWQTPHDRREATKPCPFCRRNVEVETIKCMCGEILDPDAYEAMKAKLAGTPPASRSSKAKQQAVA